MCNSAVLSAPRRHGSRISRPHLLTTSDANLHAPYTPLMLKLASIVIRVNDLPAQAAFWKAALDYIERDPAEDDWLVLKPRDADAPCISLDAHHSERVLPPRIHLDIYAEDQSAEVRRLTQLGAREVHWDGRPDDADYVIMEDPEGNRFCIVDRPDWSGWDR